MFLTFMATFIALLFYFLKKFGKCATIVLCFFLHKEQTGEQTGERNRKQNRDQIGDQNRTLIVDVDVDVDLCFPLLKDFIRILFNAHPLILSTSS